MIHHLTDKAIKAIPITPLSERGLKAWLRGQRKSIQRWVAANGFKAEPGQILLLADGHGALTRVLAGIEDKPSPWSWARLPEKLPPGAYRIDGDLETRTADGAALGWALATYVFSRYGKTRAKFPNLVWPKTCNRQRVARTIEATFLVRDLINTPANDMGPAELAAAAETLARRHKARIQVIAGDALLKKDFPAVHAVGRASAPPRAPRLIDFAWGAANWPKVTLVGKGVCFDSGGLDLKSSSNMKLMKKDMGGAAHVLGLAHMIMASKLPVRLRVLIPAVENSVSADSMRPLDVVRTRKGLTVEIGNTDAEGRVILADALAEAAREKPSLIVDMATLTGAARVALGTDLPALFANDDSLADDLVRAGREQDDPLWRLPLWQGYAKEIEGKVADLTNAPESPYAGAITAALFLERFIDAKIPWAHIDLMAWNTKSRPGRPEGGEAMALRALYALIERRFGRHGRGKESR
jgi:leucyl aminopeptidase